MKIISITLFIIFLAINIYADKNWIQIEPTNKTKTVKLDVNSPNTIAIKKAMKQAVVFKQLFDKTGKKEKVDNHDKNWFILNNKSVER